MAKSIFKVDGMSCEHCAQAVNNAINVLSGIESVDVDLFNKTVTVEYDDTQTALDKIAEAIEEQGYDVV